MNSEIRRRIKLLESQIHIKPVELHFADGTVRTISGNPAHYFALMGAIGGTSDGELLRELAWICECERVKEQAQLFGLLKAMAAGPVARGEFND